MMLINKKAGIQRFYSNKNKKACTGKNYPGVYRSNIHLSSELIPNTKTLDDVSLYMSTR